MSQGAAGSPSGAEWCLPRDARRLGEVEGRAARTSELEKRVAAADAALAAAEVAKELQDKRWARICRLGGMLCACDLNVTSW